MAGFFLGMPIAALLQRKQSEQGSTINKQQE